MKTLYNSLHEDGLIVFQLGGSPSHDDLPEELTGDYRRALLAESLEGVGFKSIHIYDESHSGFGSKKIYCILLNNVYFYLTKSNAERI